ncbi:hypothetical protein ABMA10_18740 [Plantibacter sp. RU18]
MAEDLVRFGAAAAAALELYLAGTFDAETAVEYLIEQAEKQRIDLKGPVARPEFCAWSSERALADARRDGC